MKLSNARYLYNYSLGLFFALLPFFLPAQNLVLNPSFESVTAEPYYGCEFTYATSWINPANGACPPTTDGTPDLFSTFSTGQAVVPNTFMATLFAHTGDRMCGLGTYESVIPNYREYIMTQLCSPLIAGKTYKVSFWMAEGINPQYIFHCNNIGIYFSAGPISQSGWDIIPGITPQFNIDTLITNTGWTNYSFIYSPTITANYMTVGNFFNDNNTLVQSFGTNRPQSYYFLDDFSITPVDSLTGFNLGSDTSYCDNFTLVLSTNNPNTTWSTGAIGSQITINTPGTYWASVGTGCTVFNDTIEITQHVSSNMFSLGNDTALCIGETLLLDANTPGATYVWQDGSASSSFFVNSAGMYSVTVSTATGCSASDSIIVYYNTQLPVVSLGNDIVVCGDKPVMLHGGIPDAMYIWSTNSTDSILAVDVSGNYSVTVTNGCGSASDEVNVQIYYDECTLLVPTAFSPNGDGINDILNAVCHCAVSNYVLRIYSRWGELLFETKNINEGWNGAFKGIKQPLDVYVYYIDYFNFCENRMKQISGNITLLK